MIGIEPVSYTHLFSPKIFEYFRERKVSCLQGFRQIRGITILYAVLLLVFFPLLLFFISFAMGCMEPGAHRTVLENVLTCENVLNVLTASSLTSLFALIFAFSLCRFMHTRRSTDLFHSLPLKRGPMLLGRFLSLSLIHICFCAFQKSFCRWDSWSPFP